MPPPMTTIITTMATTSVAEPSIIHCLLPSAALLRAAARLAPPQLALAAFRGHSAPVTPMRNPDASRSITGETARVRDKYDKNARHYDRQISFFERVLFRDGREWVCSRAEGAVLEIAAGTGRNLPFYPPQVQLTAIELSAAMLERARARALEVGREVDLRQADAQQLPFDDESFDSVVCTLSLCTIPNDRAAAAEVRRVLRPG